MTRNARGIILLFLFSSAVATASSPQSPPSVLEARLSQPVQQSLQREARLIVDLLQNYHYSGRPFRDVPNEEIIHRYLTALDPQAEFLIEPDHAALRRRFNRTLKSVYVFRGDLQPAFEIFYRFATRALERLQWAQTQLAQPLDPLGADAQYDAGDGKPAQDAAESQRRWELRLHELVLQEQLGGCDESAARSRVAAKLRSRAEALRNIDALTVREQFLDAMLRCFDPHSGYFAEETARAFAQDMGAETAGIGIAFTIENRRCIVIAVGAGSPVDLHSELRPGDELVAIAADGGTWRSTEQLRRTEISALLSGELDQAIGLRFLRPGEEGVREAVLKRGVLLQGDDRATGGVALVPDGSPDSVRRVGFITLPSFYGQPQDKSAASATRDVRELLDKMKSNTLDALVIDLRQNPGGLLLEAVSLSGLFVHDATIMHAGQVGAPPELFY